MNYWTQDLLFVLCSVAVATTNTDDKCWLMTTYKGIPYIKTAMISYKSAYNRDIYLDESQLKEITDPNPSVHCVGSNYSGKPFYTDFQDSAVAKLRDSSDPETLNWVPIYIASVSTQTGGALLMCLEPPAINVTVQGKNNDADSSAYPERNGKIYKCICNKDPTPWIIDLTTWSGKIVLEFEGKELEAFENMKENAVGEYAVTFLFIRVNNGTLRRFVNHTNYIGIGGKVVGDVVSNKVKFWIRPSGADFIILIDADIEEFTRTIKILRSAKPCTMDLRTFTEVKNTEASKWRNHLKTGTGHAFGISRLPMTGSKTQLLGITIDKDEKVKIYKRVLSIFDYFKDVKIRYKCVEDPKL